MNLVVVYTNQPLKNVWLEIASTLRGSSQKSEVDFFGDDKNSAEAWRDHSEIYTRVWTEISRQQRIDYLLGQETDLVNSLKSSFWSDIQNDKEYFEEPEPTDRIVQFLIEKDLCVKNLLKRERTTQPLHGCDELWIQSGDVFIALCEKKDDDDENLHEQPEAVWDKLNEALHSWYPSFYRVVLSEIQNRIEDSNFSMTKVLRKTHHEQIALLWSILKEATDKQLEVSESIFSHLLEDIFDELLAKSEDSIPEFIKTIASSIDGTIPAHIPYSKERASEHNAFMKELISKAKGNFRENLENFDNDFCLKIAHALNEIQCTKSLNVGYITTGTVLKSPKEAKIHWYVCVTPSCDTVPTQKTNDCAKSLYPHRLLTFVKLNEEDLGDALGVANQSSHIFVTDAGRRVALRVVNPNSKLPDLVKFIVQDHVSPLTFEGKEAISFKTKKKTGGMEQVTQRLIPVAQLKPAYAARFQAIQSHYEGRIGVDYTTVDFSTADHSGESSIS